MMMMVMTKPLPLRGRGRWCEAPRVRVIGSPRSTCYVPTRSPSPSVLRTIDLSREAGEV